MNLDAEVDRLADEVFDDLMAWSPFDAIIVGVRDHDAAVQEISEAAERHQAARAAALLDAAQDIDPTALDPERRITREVVLHELTTALARLAGRHAEFAVATHMQSPTARVLQDVPKVTIAAPTHASDYLARCRQLGAYLDDAVERLRDGIAAGRTPPRRAVEDVTAQLDAVLAAPLADDPLLGPDVQVEWDGADRWRADVAEAVRSVVRPALARYRDALRDEVLPHARPDERVGVGWLPDGDAVYRAELAAHTTTDRTPEEVHELGRAIVADLADEYRELGGQVLGTSDLATVFARLRDDPALRFDTAAQVRDAAEAALRRAEAAVPDWFGRLPQAPCEVRSVPASEAEGSTIAYYMPPSLDGSRPGVYYVNDHVPAESTRYEAEVLAFHESVPGHHLQIAIAQELDLPRIRRLNLTTAYVEGWALYTERLCDEMGLYGDDVARLGMLSFDSWRAGRLVVDTGMHALGWSRQEAIDYLVENSPQTRENIENEVDRYIAWPGQACAYMIGRRELRRLRADAEERLGPRFDVRDFHDVVLTHGPVPLAVLDGIVERWLDRA